MIDTKKESTLTRLYSKWEDLKGQAKQDCCSIRKDQLEQDFDLAGLSIRWLNHQHDYQRLFMSLEAKRRRTQRDLTEFYKMESNMRFDTKDEMLLFIETDERYISILEQSKVAECIVKYCISVLDKLHAKGFEVRRWIDYQQWIHGGR